MVRYFLDAKDALGFADSFELDDVIRFSEAGEDWEVEFSVKEDMFAATLLCDDDPFVTLTGKTIDQAATRAIKMSM